MLRMRGGTEEVEGVGEWVEVEKEEVGEVGEGWIDSEEEGSDEEQEHDEGAVSDKKNSESEEEEEEGGAEGLEGVCGVGVATEGGGGGKVVR